MGGVPARERRNIVGRHTGYQVYACLEGWTNQGEDAGHDGYLPSVRLAIVKDCQQYESSPAKADSWPEVTADADRSPSSFPISPCCWPNNRLFRKSLPFLLNSRHRQGRYYRHTQCAGFPWWRGREDLSGAEPRWMRNMLIKRTAMWLLALGVSIVLGPLASRPGAVQLESRLSNSQPDL